ncbi:hypothetical protein [Bifidobacterium sp. SO4]|uniref:hypothetical protein n=1 Tax=Bifidobacterium sp. SO4 TaxID=2809030 RepID=UPI001BDD25FB|nr:hypothetical protein [Bifidobacterium sp. SO4]MBT1171006.1 hypothetical protein [Bifidobacterium sp. SO4]
MNGLLEWLMVPGNLVPVLCFVLLLVAAAGVVRLALITDDMWHTIAAITGGRSHIARIWVTYGWLHLPVTFGRPRSIHVRAPVREVAHVRDEEQAAELGRQLRDTYDMDGVETWVSQGVRYWELSR